MPCSPSPHFASRAFAPVSSRGPPLPSSHADVGGGCTPSCRLCRSLTVEPEAEPWTYPPLPCHHVTLAHAPRLPPTCHPQLSLRRRGPQPASPGELCQAALPTSTCPPLCTVSPGGAVSDVSLPVAGDESSCCCVETRGLSSLIARCPRAELSSFLKTTLGCQASLPQRGLCGRAKGAPEGGAAHAWEPCPVPHRAGASARLAFLGQLVMSQCEWGTVTLSHQESVFERQAAETKHRTSSSGD